MRRGRWLRAAAAGCLIALGATACGSNATNNSPAPGATAPTPAVTKRLLVVTHTTGFRHTSIPIAESTLQEIGTRSGLYRTEFCRTGEDVTRLLITAELARYDAVFFANTSGNLGIPDLGAFVTWVSSGHAFLGTHSASDTYHDRSEYLDMLGGEVATHGSIAEGTIRVDDPADPSVAHLAPRFTIVDELYRITRINRSAVHMLLSIDSNPADGVGTPGAAVDLPISWRKSLGAGRVFYTALGHREEVWQDARFQQHLLGALRWALGG
jgi:type 1 glutamine amidotransferase